MRLSARARRPPQSGGGWRRAALLPRTSCAEGKSRRGRTMSVPRRYFCVAGRAAGVASAPMGLPLLGGARRRVLASCGLSATGAGPWWPRRRSCGGPGAAGGGFRPARVAVVVKTTRYEFEQQRYRYAGLCEEDLKQLVSGAGTAGSRRWAGRAARPRAGAVIGARGCPGLRRAARAQRTPLFFPLAARSEKAACSEVPSEGSAALRKSPPAPGEDLVAFPPSPLALLRFLVSSFVS